MPRCHLTGLAREAALAIVVAAAPLVCATHAGAAFTTVYAFCSLRNCKDGSLPTGGVAIDILSKDSGRNVYGTTQNGGRHGAGAVFGFDTLNSAYYPIHSFCAKSGCHDGEWPMAAPMVLGRDIYGTTYADGGGSNPAGTVYAIHHKKDGSWPFRTIYNFCSQTSCADGANPAAALVPESYFVLAGTTTGGGLYGGGTLFRLTQQGSSFCECADGGNPEGDIVFDTYNATSRIYGTASDFGAHGDGSSGGTLVRFDY